MPQTLIDRIQLAIEADDTARQWFSKHVIRTYNEADAIEKGKIDIIFVALCGFPLANLIEKDSQEQEKQATQTL